MTHPQREPRGRGSLPWTTEPRGDGRATEYRTSCVWEGPRSEGHRRVLPVYDVGPSHSLDDPLPHLQPVILYLRSPTDEEQDTSDCSISITFGAAGSPRDFFRVSWAGPSSRSIRREPKPKTGERKGRSERKGPSRRRNSRIKGPVTSVFTKVESETKHPLALIMVRVKFES